MAGAKLSEFNLDDDSIAPHVAVKEAVFPLSLIHISEPTRPY